MKLTALVASVVVIGGLLGFGLTQAAQEGIYRMYLPSIARNASMITPLPAVEWDLQDIQVEGSIVTVVLRVHAGIDVRVTLDGREPYRLETEVPLFNSVFENVASGKHTVQIRDVVGHQEIAEVVVP